MFFGSYEECSLAVIRNVICYSLGTLFLSVYLTHTHTTAFALTYTLTPHSLTHTPIYPLHSSVLSLPHTHAVTGTLTLNHSPLHAPIRTVSPQLHLTPQHTPHTTSLPHSYTLPHSNTHPSHSLILTPTHNPTHFHTLSHTISLPHSNTHSHTLQAIYLTHSSPE